MGAVKTGMLFSAELIEAVVDESARQGAVVMDPGSLEAMNQLRDFMFERVYLRPEAEDQRDRAIEIIRDLVEHYIVHPGKVPPTYQHDDANGVTRAIDYVSGMTDRFAIREWEQLK